MNQDILQFEKITFIVDSVYDASSASCEALLSGVISEQVITNLQPYDYGIPA